MHKQPQSEEESQQLLVQLDMVAVERRLVQLEEKVHKQPQSEEESQQLLVQLYVVVVEQLASMERNKDRRHS